MSIIMSKLHWALRVEWTTQNNCLRANSGRILGDKEGLLLGILKINTDFLACGSEVICSWKLPFVSRKTQVLDLFNFCSSTELIWSLEFNCIVLAKCFLVHFLILQLKRV